MDYCILVTLSRDTISFRYNRADGDNRFVDFVQDGSGEMPFAIECVGNEFVIGKSALDAARSKLAQEAFSDIFDTCKSGRTFYFANRDEPLNKLPYYAIRHYIGKILSDCFYGVEGTIDSNVARLPLILLFTPELDTDKQLFIRRPFEEGGFQNVCSISYHQLLTPIVMENLTDNQKVKAVVMVSVDKDDLVMQLYDSANYQPLGDVVKVASQGRDPRLTQVADLIWKCLLGYNYQPREPEEAILLEAAERFLYSDAKSVNDTLCMSDGSMQPYMVSRVSIEASSWGDSYRIIGHYLEIELEKYGLSPSQCQAVLVGKAATDYFENIFNQVLMFFPAKKITSKEKTKMLDGLLAMVKKADYMVKELWPTAGQAQSVDARPQSGVAASVDDALVRRYKRRVNVIKKEMEKNLSEGCVAEARRKLDSLMHQLHNDGVNAYDEELEGIFSNVSVVRVSDAEQPIIDTAQRQTVGVEISNDTTEAPRINVREIRQRLAPLREQMCVDYNSAYNTFVELKRQAELVDNKSLWNKIEEFSILFEDERAKQKTKQKALTAKKTAGRAVVEKTASGTSKPSTLSKAVRLLQQGKYHEAKRAYAIEHNSVMADVCTKLIRGFNRMERAIRPEFASVKSSHNIEKARAYIDELSRLRDVMTDTEVGLNTSVVDRLIEEYKRIK